MNLDKIIKYKLLELSNKYDIYLTEIQKPRDNRIQRKIKFNYKIIGSKLPRIEKLFNNKRELVSWLVCLE